MHENIRIVVATADADILKCFPVLKQLRSDIEQERFVADVRTLRSQGYQLVFAARQETCVAVAGFRIGRNFAWGRYLYIEGLVAEANDRSRGYGALLIRWLETYGRKHGCQQLHLESGTQRKQAHHFYLREGFEISSFHFRKILL